MKLILTTLFYIATAIWFAHAAELNQSPNAAAPLDSSIKAKNLLPAPINAFLKTNYPNAKELAWIKTHSAKLDTLIYEVHFYNNNLLVTIEMTPAGLALVKETEVPVKDVPQALKDYAKEHKVKFAAIVEAQNEKPVYMLETTFKGQTHYAIFSMEGALVSTKKRFSLL